MSSGAFVIEVGGETAGLVVSDDHRFQFVASGPAFLPLDGQSYGSVRLAQRAADDLWRRRAKGAARG